MIHPIGRTERPLLAARPLFRATSRDGTEAGLRAAYKVGRVRVAPSEAPFVCSANRVRIGDVGLHYCRYDTSVHIEFPEMAGYRQLICLSGSGTVRSEGRMIGVNAHTTCIIPPETSFTVDYEDRYSQVVLQLDPEMLRAKAERLGLDYKADFAELQPLSVERLWRLTSIAVNLAQQFSEDIDENNIAILEMAQSLSSAFLYANLTQCPDGPDSTSGELVGSNRSTLEDYINTNWNKPVLVEDLAAAADISVRSVFVRFRERHGTTPMAYLRAVRLDQVRKLLAEGDDAASVIDIAMKCGFASFGHFARRYRDRFGELPSVTLARRAAEMS